MGVFDFIKSVGEKLGIGSEEEAPSADDLAKEVEKHGLEAKDLKVEVKGDTIAVTGTAPSNSIREKIILAMGNIDCVGCVEDNITVTNPEPEAKFHVVQKGDTLSKISRDVYGDAMKYNIIFEANRPMLEHPDKIYPGQTLRIPAL